MKMYAFCKVTSGFTGDMVAGWRCWREREGMNPEKDII